MKRTLRFQAIILDHLDPNPLLAQLPRATFVRNFMEVAMIFFYISS